MMSGTFSDRQKLRSHHRLMRKMRIEWPTIGLLSACYGFWGAAGYGLYPTYPIAALLLMGVAVALHSSLQHEVLHGHPTRSARVNEALVFAPLGVFYPYRSYKRTHLQHHADERLTDPFDDPESYYRALSDWETMPVFLRHLLSWNNTLIGRVIIGPPLMVVGFTASEWCKILKGDRKVIIAWMLHLSGLIPTLLVVSHLFGIPVWLYVGVSAYLGVSIIAIRSYCEHQWAEQPDGRTIIVENSLLAPLFLYNNLHFVHHKLPTVAWYDLPSLYRSGRADWQRMNEGYVFTNYFEVFRAFAFKAKEPVVHPVLRRDDALPMTIVSSQEQINLSDFLLPGNVVTSDLSA
ncbi:fatty acid desaturase [Agrobacterium rosae]|uniref:Fatty acid desaturase n=3 Tax=Agrobacterium rosae TaxID=1972867 RepID=A0AAE5VMI2_9HYPH|nr:fatty acid desaturase [Agrobacterium rosae]KAA3507817.1 fatty acid desaturase [Agrobacterium rosae]KAA3512796.1 fatty acid desaturase [Agrobacterium rosae]MCM2436129.1 fatty acid desaturase [Agrobacterium rosae]MQB51127.1 fatty acid desaturase [Agrobacterium rosae]POO49017.1 fatty acid desaturase [Agrobacterium rosae]